MDAAVTLPFKPHFWPPQINRRAAMRSCKCPPPFIFSVLAKKDTNKPPTTHESENIYKDNLFQVLAINHLAHCLQASTGYKSSKSGYDGLVEAARMAHKNFTPTQQQQVIRRTLDMAAPRYILNLMRGVMGACKPAARGYFFALGATFLFSWLVGPCQVRESYSEGRREKNVVYIPKCRFLKETNCVGMCTNLCKMPSQEFIKETLGTSLNMVPNFEDMSCEMIFGEEPPPMSHDPAVKQPCYKQCQYKSHQEKCI